MRIKQNNPELLIEIQQWGCYFLC
ncbi:DUF261 family protein, partial [Borrelia persica]